ncbi:MAG: hypothetical protein ACXWQO_19025 [Bdellovibrionota bacterium]
MKTFMALVLALTVSPTLAFAKAPGKRCVQRMIHSIVSEMLDPCGKPRPDADSSKEIVYFTYSDFAQGMAHYVPAENCGWDSSSGLGTMQIKFESIAGGDCRILEMRDVQ